MYISGSATFKQVSLMIVVLQKQVVNFLFDKISYYCNQYFQNSCDVRCFGGKWTLTEKTIQL